MARIKSTAKGGPPRTYPRHKQRAGGVMKLRKRGYGWTHIKRRTRSLLQQV